MNLTFAPRVRRFSIKLHILTAMVVSLPATQLRAVTTTAPSSSFLPLAAGEHWVLKHPGTTLSVRLDVISADSSGAHLRFTTPWNSADWQMQYASSRLFLTAYGSGGTMTPLPAPALFFDFNPDAGSTWSNSLGAFGVKATNARVVIGKTTYSGVTVVSQTFQSVQNEFAFASGVGLIRFVTNGFEFDLDASASTRASAAQSTSIEALPPVGLIANPVAGEAWTAATATNRIASIAAAGSRLLIGYGRWTQLEPAPGQFVLDSLRFQVAEEQQLNMVGSWTFCVIDTAVRNVPPELAQVRWNDPVMIDRTIRIIDAMAREFRGRINWFQFGNEADIYFSMHPDEIADFMQLLNIVKQRLAIDAPGIPVSVTFSYGGLRRSGTTLSGINALSDLLVITWGGYNADFSVEDPSTVAGDFANLQTLAAGRRLLLQEISYPSAAQNGSSPDQQAAFDQAVLANLRNAGGSISGANFYIYADYSPSDAQTIATGAGLGNSPLFVSFMETLGMFDLSGAAKPSWRVFTSELQK